MSPHWQWADDTFENCRRVPGPLNIVTYGKRHPKMDYKCYFPAGTNLRHNEGKGKNYSCATESMGVP